MRGVGLIEERSWRRRKRSTKVQSYNYTQGFGEWALGYAADTLLGGLFGTGMAYVIPKGRELFKGMVGGASLWALTLTFGNMLKVDGLAKSTPGEMATMLGTSVLFGGLQGAVFGNCASQLTAQSHPLLVKNVSNSRYNQGAMNVDNMDIESNQDKAGLQGYIKS